jgi:hypothetical protein
MMIAGVLVRVPAGRRACLGKGLRAVEEVARWRKGAERQGARRGDGASV